jgi:hypothetical protein
MKLKRDPTIEELHAALSYDEKTGVFTWKKRNRNLTGVEAGGICTTSGYRRIRFYGRLVLAHRIAIAMTTGKWPEDQVDHINGNRTDNRLENLRPVSKGENLLNKSRYKNNKTGVVGVHWHKQHRKWCATIQKNKTTKTIGVFSDFDAAVYARQLAEVDLKFHENHGRDKNV